MILMPGTTPPPTPVTIPRSDIADIIGDVFPGIRRVVSVTVTVDGPPTVQVAAGPYAMGLDDILTRLLGDAAPPHAVAATVDPEGVEVTALVTDTTGATVWPPETRVHFYPISPAIPEGRLS